MDRPIPSGDAVSVPELVEQPPQRVDRDHRGGRTPAVNLFWRLFLGNGLVFTAGALVLVLSPATVSTPVSVREVTVLAVGFA